MNDFVRNAGLESDARKIARRQWFWLHSAIFVGGQIALFVLWANLSSNHPWFWYPLVGWLILLAGHAALAFVVRSPEEIMIDLERQRSRDATRSH